MVISFPKVLIGEMHKMKNTYGLLIALALPVLVTTIVTIYYIKEADGFSGGGTNPWQNFTRYIIQFYYLLYPLFVALIAHLVNNVEHKSKGFKYLFTLPSNKFNFYFSKVFIVVFWLACSILLGYALVFLSANLLGALFPEIGFQDFEFRAVITAFFVKLFLVMISILAIHFFLSIYWDNFIISLGLACFMVIFGAIISSWEYNYLIPYTYSSIIFGEFFQQSVEIFTKEMWWSFGYALIFFSGGFLLLRTKNI